MGFPETPPIPSAPDHDLLREYAEHSTESAFRTLVERHSGLVYGVARRLVGHEHAAAEITQSVFLALARKGSTLSRAVPVAGWLHTAARYAASHWLRGEARRRERENAAAAEGVHAVNAESEHAWEEISPWLDAALASLDARDREAVLLRFFEQRRFSEVAAGLGTTEDAAKMRVGRALRKLRRFLQRRGAVVNATLLTTCLAGHAAITAPAPVVTASVQLAGQSVAQGTPIAALATAIIETMRWARVVRFLSATAAIVVMTAAVGLGLSSLRSPSDLTASGAAEKLLRDSTVITGTWRATTAGLTSDERAWTHLSVPGPFAGDYSLQVAYRQQNPTGVIELILPAGPQKLLVVLQPPVPLDRPIPVSVATPPQPIDHIADVDVRVRDGELSLSVKLDGIEIADTKSVPAAIQRANLVSQPPGTLGLGAVRTTVIFTRVEAHALGKEPYATR